MRMESDIRRALERTRHLQSGNEKLIADTGDDIYRAVAAYWRGMGDCLEWMLGEDGNADSKN